MRILHLEPTPISRVAYVDAGPSGTVRRCELPVLRGVVDRLPPGLDALVLASDLQGRSGDPTAVDEPPLLGEILAGHVFDLGAAGSIPAAPGVGVILAGDLYTTPALDRRGGTGDVRPVWREWAAAFRWVAGVAGNHDTFWTADAAREMAEFRREERVHLLDGHVVELDGLRIGGLAGIVGNPRRAFRREERAYLDAMDALLRQDLDVLVLHEGPGDSARGLPGVDAAGRLLAAAPRTLVVRGHDHWEEPIAEFDGGAQVLNVDARAVVLVRRGASQDVGRSR